MATFIRERNKVKEYKQVGKELRKLDGYALHKDIRFKYPRRKIWVNMPGEVLSVDLAETSNLKGKVPTPYWLVCVDGFSKKSYVRQIKNKRGETVVNALKSVFREIGTPVIYVYSDFGKEFVGSVTRNFLKSNKVKLYHIHSTIKSSFAERHIRYLKGRVQRFLTQTGKPLTAKILQNIVKTYNDTYNRVIGRSPNEVTKEDARDIWERMFGEYVKASKASKRKPKLHVGDLVKISRAKLTFEKGKMNINKPHDEIIPSVLICV